MAKFSKENQPENFRGFTKGVSGNPGGKPKGWKELAAIARTRSPEAIEALMNFIIGDIEVEVPVYEEKTDSNGKVSHSQAYNVDGTKMTARVRQKADADLQLKAIDMLLDRSLGKNQKMDLETNENQGPAQIGRIERVIVEVNDRRSERPQDRIIDVEATEVANEAQKPSGGHARPLAETPQRITPPNPVRTTAPLSDPTVTKAPVQVAQPVAQPAQSPVERTAPASVSKQPRMPMIKRAIKA